MVVVEDVTVSNSYLVLRAKKEKDLLCASSRFSSSATHPSSEFSFVLFNSHSIFLRFYSSF